MKVFVCFLFGPFFLLVGIVTRIGKGWDWVGCDSWWIFMILGVCMLLYVGRWIWRSIVK